MSQPGGVFVGIACAETARFTDFWESLFHQGNHASVVAVERGGNLAKNRNRLTERFLESGREWLWYLDDDQVLLPGTLHKLLNHDKPVVSGLYVSRNYPFLPLVYGEARDDGRAQLKELRPGQGGLTQVGAVGAGCLLVQRAVLETLTPPYWTIGQVEPDALSDDLEFCRRVREAGHVIYCDLDTRVGHKSQCTLWPERSDAGWGTTLVTGNRPVCHLQPPV